VSVALLLYAPVTQQRRFVQGLQIPLAIVATVGLFQTVLPWLARTRIFKTLLQRPGYSTAGLQRLTVASLLAFAAIANLYIFIGTTVMLGIVQPYPLFRPTSELQAMDWLRTNTSHDDAILSAYWTGSYLPYRAGNTVFVGQRYETAQFEEKWRAAEKFFSADADDTWRRALLSRFSIAYVFAGRAEREQNELNLAQLSYLKPIFSNNEATIYRVELQ
jgi:hypothetical protein